MFSSEYENMNTARKPPVSAHPAFPAVVALWFAALFGVGMMIVPAHVLETLVARTGLAAALPAAAPPLGDTARIAIASVAALLGAVLGYLAAKRLGRTNARPVEIEDEADPLGEEVAFTFEELPSDEEPMQRPRRRALALTEDERPAEDPLAQKAPVTEQDEVPVGIAPHIDLPDTQPSETIAEEAPGIENETAVTIDPVEVDDQVPVPEKEEAADEPENIVEGTAAPPPSFPPSLTCESAQDNDEAAPASDPAPNREESASAKQPGLVQLVQKLEATLERHRNWRAEREAAGDPVPPPAALPVAMPAATAIGADYGPATVQTAIAATATYLGMDVAPIENGTPPREVKVPTSEQPFAAFAAVETGSLLAADDIGDDDALAELNASLALPRVQEADEAIEHSDPVADDEANEDAPTPPTPLRRASNDDHDRALRDAIMNLQRMGK
ncbi:hypothetical protein [Aurantiacibacter aquimixticola]|uniref:Uncharacterized protein n=1 Tax=Aurantiacibacter aquimixticola TaxID=1958945 RepID=A0A419RUK8_9SPHN|nr:hypothetical protein [Aurantiacibacter aquimixticola]RJY09434.1 hypothetical protein D6201_08760 [Aurantiacibacter aquimixticola]